MKTPVVYVWSASDQEKYQKYEEAARWLMAPLILLGLLIFIVSLWAFIEFRDCSWKIAPPTASYPVLIIFFIISIIILLLSAYGLVIFNREDLKHMSLFIRFCTLFSVLSVILMIILWICTVYMQSGKFTIDSMQLSYICLKETSECWDNIQEIEICEKSKNLEGIPVEAAYQEGCKNHLYSRSLIYILLTSISWVLCILLFLVVIFLAIHLLRGLKIKEKLEPIIG
ncbi:unnamed protein product [Nezara viridula]|uniref:Uncharacterized protein n=1 Tax=Nezara viridula TaxID=85310 RepID=A0A9P0H9B2_NEZVI|nr:unnamed protein product [Nezara viridula]